MLSLEGKQLGNYDIIRRIRVGGMGAVYEGRQRTAFDRRVAIKVILGDYASDPDMRRRFAREAKTVARLHHPHILALIEFGDEQGILYLVMPYIEGGTLTSYLRHNLPSLGEVANLYEQILDAVECAHDHGLIHRDIKSSNVLLELRRNTPPYAYLADFGLVRSQRQSTSSQIGKPIPLEQVPGTPHYMAPEQTLGIVTPLTDIYALGVLLFQMLTGNLPYNDPDDIRVIQMHLQSPIPLPCEHDASIPIELNDVVRKAMAKRPEDRFRTVAELRKAFFQALEGPTASAPVTEDGPSTVRPTRPIEPEDVSLLVLDHTQDGPIKNKKTVALNGRPLDPPKPIIMHQRPRTDEATPPVAVHEKRERVERLDRSERAEKAERLYTPENPRQRLRITEEPIASNPRKRKRFLFPFIAVLVPLILIFLLLAPRFLNLNLIPTNISLPGASSTTVIRITPKTSLQQNSFILTAAPQNETTNLIARTIPDQLISNTASDNTSITTTGINQVDGTQAHGVLQFSNATNKTITIQSGMVFTSNSGIQVKTTQGAIVPAKQGEPGPIIQVPAITVVAGQAGNIAIDNIFGTYSNLYVSNPSAFTGGSDNTTVHYFAQADFDTAKTNLINKIEKQLNTQLQQKIPAGEVMVGPPTYKVEDVTTDKHVNEAANNIQMNINIQGSVPAYQKSIATTAVTTLLKQQAQKKLGSNYQLQGTLAVSGNPTTNPGKGGIIYLTFTVAGTWRYNLSGNQIKNLSIPIKGTSSDAAKKYLMSQPGIANASIQLPFGMNHLPSSSNDIKIILAPNQ